MMAFVYRWLVTAASLALAAQLLGGIWFGGASAGQEELTDKAVPLALVALISCAVTAFVKPILQLLSIPFIIVTLGFFLLVLNALLLKFTAWLADKVDIDFHVVGFWPAFWGAVIISIATWFLDMVFEPEDD